MGKKRKCFLNHQSAEGKRFKETRYDKLTVGIPGILITHDRGRERLCRNDAFALLNYYMDQWYGEAKSSPAATSLNESEDESDIASALDQEILKIKDETSHKNQQKRRFCALKSGCNNIVFVKTQGITPSEFVQKMIEDIYKHGHVHSIPKAKQVLRMHPGDVSCKAHLTSIKQAAEAFLPTAFQNLVKKHQSNEENPFVMEYSVLYRGRNNEHLGMHVVTEAIFEAAKEVCPLWKHNCRSSAIVVLVDVVTNVCLMSVVQDYIRYKKFNIRELFSVDHSANSDVTVKSENVES